MTVRTKFAGSITVYAGPAAELADVADSYAAGTRSRPRDCHPELFQRAAEMLRTGQYPAIDLGPVRFYRDRPSGRPFKGPFAPEPNEAWKLQQETLKLARR